MRSYEQRCGIAKALELIGDRWTLLIVRELLTLGACRYTDLRNGLPGIATNLLAQRLRELQEVGLVDVEEAPPPVATTLYQLTERGQALEPVVMAIAEWGLPLLAGGDERESFQTHWLVLPLRSEVEDAHPERGLARLQLDAEDEPVFVEVDSGRVTARVGRAPNPDLVLRGSGRTIAQLMLGRIDLAAALSRGLTAEGDTRVLARLRLKPRDAGLRQRDHV